MERGDPPSGRARVSYTVIPQGGREPSGPRRGAEELWGNRGVLGRGDLEGDRRPGGGGRLVTLTFRGTVRGSRGTPHPGLGAGPEGRWRDVGGGEGESGQAPDVLRALSLLRFTFPPIAESHSGHEPPGRRRTQRQGRDACHRASRRSRPTRSRPSPAAPIAAARRTVVRDVSLLRRSWGWAREGEKSVGLLNTCGARLDEKAAARAVAPYQQEWRETGEEEGSFWS